jgi:hypothetical protein
MRAERYANVAESVAKMTTQTEATMDRIYYWRNRARETQQALETAYQNDLPVGTLVAYTQGGNDIVVEIVKPWGAHRCKVRSLSSGKTYLLDYVRINRIV